MVEWNASNKLPLYAMSYSVILPDVRYLRSIIEMIYFTDIDECNDTSSCGVEAYCTNFDGGYNCTCKKNFPKGDPTFHCYGSIGFTYVFLGTLPPSLITYIAFKSIFFVLNFK
jgi:hypothetical protein